MSMTDEAHAPEARLRIRAPDALSDAGVSTTGNTEAGRPVLSMFSLAREGEAGVKDFFTRSLLRSLNLTRWTRQRGRRGDSAYYARIGRLGGDVRHSRRLRCGDRVFPLPPLAGSGRPGVPRPTR